VMLVLVVVVLISDSVFRGSRFGAGGVQLGGTRTIAYELVDRGSAHCWVLRRHLVGVVLWQGRP
jgi:hypothetical protein